MGCILACVISFAAGVMLSEPAKKLGKKLLDKINKKANEVDDDSKD